MNRNAGLLALSLARAASRGEVIPAGLPELQPESVSEVLVRNRAHVIVYRRLEEQGGEAKQSPLGRYLRAVVIEEGVRIKERGKLCSLVAEALTREGIEYAFFKTFSLSGTTGVDIDLVIPESEFERATRSLLSAGFRSIDSLEKRYATGFVLPGSGLVVDLHTAITVAGHSYFPSEVVLQNTRMLRIQAGRGESDLSVAVEWVDSFLMALHSMIKEGTMRFQEAYDITAGVAPAEVDLQFSRDSLASFRDPLLAGLRVASFFMGSSLRTDGLGSPRGSEWKVLERDAFAKIARGELPLEINQLMRVGALLKLFPAVHGNAAILKALKTTFTYKRNLEHAARLTLLRRS